MFFPHQCLGEQIWQLLADKIKTCLSVLTANDNEVKFSSDCHIEAFVQILTLPIPNDLGPPCYMSKYLFFLRRNTLCFSIFLWTSWILFTAYSIPVQNLLFHSLLSPWNYHRKVLHMDSSPPCTHAAIYTRKVSDKANTLNFLTTMSHWYKFVF